VAGDAGSFQACVCGGCGVPSGGHNEHVLMQIRALPLNDKCP